MAPIRCQNLPPGSATGSTGQRSESGTVPPETSPSGPDPAPALELAPASAPTLAPAPVLSSTDEFFRQLIEMCIEKV